MVTLEDGQAIFIDDIVDIVQENSCQVICSGKVVKFIEVSKYNVISMSQHE